MSLDAESPRVHAGFFLNVRATRVAVMGELQHALERRSLLDPRMSVDHPLEALYVTGHSLGGAMAALFALSVAGTAEHRAMAEKLRASTHSATRWRSSNRCPSLRARWDESCTATSPPATSSQRSRRWRGGSSRISGMSIAIRRASGGARRLPPRSSST
jgi:hypothetical protein